MPSASRWDSRAADPIVGLVIACAIGVVLVVAARDVFGRLLDRVDPELVDTAHDVLARQPGVRGGPAGAGCAGSAIGSRPTPSSTSIRR